MRDGEFWFFEDKKNEIKIIKDIDYGCPFHYHNNIEMLYILSGEHKMTVNGETQLLYKDDICFVNSLDSHIFYTSKDNGTHILVSFPKALFNEFEAHYPNSVFKNFLTDKQHNVLLFPYLSHMLDNFGNFSTYLKKSYIYLLLGLLERSYGVLKDNNKSKENQEILMLLNNNYKEKITREDLAKKLGYSANYFSSLFISRFGISFVEYLNVIRYEKVQQMLQNNKEGKTVLEAVLSCGFDSLATYYRVKRKYNSMLY